MGVSFLFLCLLGVCLSESRFAERSINENNWNNRRLTGSPLQLEGNWPGFNRDVEHGGPRLPPPYLHLPMFQQVRAPLLEKERLKPTNGTGKKDVPENIKNILLPSNSLQPKSPHLPRGVALLCQFNKMYVRVYKGILGSQTQISNLSLGTCKVNKSTKKFVFFLYNLDECGSKRSMINNRVVYSNTLHYTPTEHTGLIRRVVPINLPIHCHFNRFHYSYKIGYVPIKSTAVTRFKVLKRKGEFTLSAFNDRWERLAPTEYYVIGHPMYFEAKSFSHSEDKRLLIHSCFVTASRAPTSKPRFNVIENFGCMVDSKLNGSRSKFIPYKPSVSRFSVDAFLFHDMTNQQLYMHCEMSVGSQASTQSSKACNYNLVAGRWEELYGADSACSCCDSKCSTAAAPAATSKTVTSNSWLIENPAVRAMGEASALLLEEEALGGDTATEMKHAEDVAFTAEPNPEPHLTFEDIWVFDD